MTEDLLTPIVDQGVRHTNFFEGRLLTARDLKDEQKAARELRHKLGRAIGAGVVEGLWVTLENDGSDGEAAVVKITGGLAINEKGQTLELAKDHVEIVLASPVRPPEDQTRGKTFLDCDRLRTDVPSGPGTYLLLASPASEFSEERAPKSGLVSNGKIIGCGNRYEVEGVQFRVEFVDPGKLTGISVQTRNELAKQPPRLDSTNPTPRTKALSLLRNLIAHTFFGTEGSAGFAIDPVDSLNTAGNTHRFGALDDMMESGALTKCDIPLAAFHWSRDGISFLDSWSVRRRVCANRISGNQGKLALLFGNPCAEAQFFQFQEQLGALLELQSPIVGLKASEYFRYLPPVSFLPGLWESGQTELNVEDFTDGLTVRGPLFIEGARLPLLLSAGFRFPPIDVSAGELIWLYQVREAQQNIDAGSLNKKAFAVLANGQIQSFVEPRFDAVRWDYSNFALSH